MCIYIICTMHAYIVYNYVDYMHHVARTRTSSQRRNYWFQLSGMVYFQYGPPFLPGEKFEVDYNLYSFENDNTDRIFIIKRGEWCLILLLGLFYFNNQLMNNGGSISALRPSPPLS